MKIKFYERINMFVVSICGLVVSNFAALAFLVFRRFMVMYDKFWKICYFELARDLDINLNCENIEKKLSPDTSTKTIYSKGFHNLWDYRSIYRSCLNENKIAWNFIFFSFAKYNKNSLRNKNKHNFHPKKQQALHVKQKTQYKLHNTWQRPNKRKHQLSITFFNQSLFY